MEKLKKYFHPSLLIPCLALSLVFGCGRLGKNSDDEGPTSTYNTIPPTTPQNLKIVGEDDSLVLTWDPIDEIDLGGYIIYYGKTSPNTVFDSGIDVKNVTSKALYNLENEVSYTFVVAAYDIYGNYSDYSQEVTGTPTDKQAPNDPTNFFLRAVMNDQSSTPTPNYFELTWNNPTNRDFEGVLIIRKEGSAVIGRADGIAVYQGKDASFTDKNVEIGVRYYYRIFAYDDVPNYSDENPNHSVQATSKNGILATITEE